MFQPSSELLSVTSNGGPGNRADGTKHDGRNVGDIGVLFAHRKARPHRVPVVDDIGQSRIACR